jgi:uncharacterized OB-fold protein
MSEYKEETTSVHGNWPLSHYRWKSETVKLMKEFLEAFKDRKVLGLKCPDCGQVYTPPKPFCRCLGRPEEWVEVSDEGLVTTFTFSGAWSYEGMLEGEGESRIIVGVKLDGADTMFLTMLEGAEREEVNVGMRVRIKWPETPQGKISDIMNVEKAT